MRWVRHRRIVVVALLIAAALGVARRSPTGRFPTDQWPAVPRAPQAPGEPPTA